VEVFSLVSGRLLFVYICVATVDIDINKRGQENTTTEADKNLDIWLYRQVQYVAGLHRLMGS
jgi:hypothetical protein